MNRIFLVFAVIFLASFFFPSETLASHTWGNYHWARTANPFNLKLGDNLSSNWDPYLVTTSADWSQSSVLDTMIVSGATTARRCKPSYGKAEICNSTYGKNGWLGIAQVWSNGDHIYQGTVKLNDTYFNSVLYNKPEWKNLVLCQEVGHLFGLDHQDEAMENPPVGTCMDYSIDPVLNQHPNFHDFEMLDSIYAHLDNTNTVGQSSPSPLWGFGSNRFYNLDNKTEWGKLIRQRAKTALFERDLGSGHKVSTFVFNAQ